MDLLHQPSHWDHDLAPRVPPGGGSAFSQALERRRHPRGLYRHFAAGARHRRPPGGARQGPGGRLVRFPFHPHALHRFGGLPHIPSGLGVVPPRPGDRHPAFQELQLRRVEPDDVHARRRVLQQPGDDAAVPADPVGLHGDVSRAGSLGQRNPVAGVHAHRRPADHQIPGQISFLLLAGSRSPLPCSIPPNGSI